MKTKPKKKKKKKKKNPLTNPKSQESRIRGLELALFGLSCAAIAVIYDQKYSNLKRMDEALCHASKALPNSPTKPS